MLPDRFKETHLFEIFVRTFEIFSFDAFFPFRLRIAFCKIATVNNSKFHDKTKREYERKDRKCYQKKVPDRRDQHEKNKSLHEAKSLFREIFSYL